MNYVKEFFSHIQQKASKHNIFTVLRMPLIISCFLLIGDSVVGQSDKLSGENLRQTIRLAVSGLKYVSESDYPVELLEENKSVNLTTTYPDKSLVDFSVKTENLSVTKVSDIDSFFAPLTTLQDWHGIDEKKTVLQYQSVLKLLKANLFELKVIRKGEIEIDIFIIGKDTEGNYIVLHTKSVET